MPLIVKAFLSENEVFDSGLIIVRDLAHLFVLEISAPGAISYKIRMKFTGIEGRESAARWSSAEGAYNLDIVNVDSPMGLTTHGPLIIGSYERREILLDFAVNTSGTDPKNAPKLFFYTLRAGDLIDGSR
jgi:hypothetical protein